MRAHVLGQADCEKRIKAAHQIHPEVFDRVCNDWSTLVKFQRTRGVLRLMAAVIHILWARGGRNPLILPSTLPHRRHAGAVRADRLPVGQLGARDRAGRGWPHRVAPTDGWRGAEPRPVWGGAALVCPADVPNPGDVETAAAQLEDRFGPIDVWVNNAMASVFSVSGLCLGSERAPTASDGGGYVDSRAAGERRPL